MQLILAILFVKITRVTSSPSHAAAGHDTLFSALWLADNVGSFFAEGGALYIHSPIEPSVVHHGCQGWAIWGNAIWDHDAKIVAYTAFYHAGRMINNEWVTHRSGTHHLYSVDVGIEDAAGNDLVTSYAVRRPDGQWALLLINKDRENAHAIRVAFENSGKTGHFSGATRMVTFGSEHTSGTARTPPLTPIRTCRPSFRPSTPQHKLCSRSPKLPSPFCAVKSQAFRPERRSSQ